MSIITKIKGYLNVFDMGLGFYGNTFLFITIILLIIIGGAVLIFLIVNNRKYRHKIPLYKTVGNVPTRVATYKAKDFPVGRAGDTLWYVAKKKKYISPATIQSAPNEYLHWEREDGEWINFSLGDLNEEQKKAGIKFIHQDMRGNRVAIEKLLEARYSDKSFWEKWGLVIGYVIFFLVITVSLVIIFYQFSGIVDKVSQLVDKMIAFEKTYRNEDTGLVPSLIFLFLNLNPFKLKK